MPAFAGSKAKLPPYPIWLYNDTLWQKEQLIHLQTQQQLQAQDEYRRQLLLQNQQWQLDRLRDEQQKLEYRQRNSIMYDYADRLRKYGALFKSAPATSKKKPER